MRGRTREVREERAFGVHVGEPAMKPVRARRRRVLERDANFPRGAIGARAFQTIRRSPRRDNRRCAAADTDSGETSSRPGAIRTDAVESFARRRESLHRRERPRRPRPRPRIAPPPPPRGSRRRTRGAASPRKTSRGRRRTGRDRRRDGTAEIRGVRRRPTCRRRASPSPPGLGCESGTGESASSSGDSIAASETCFDAARRATRVSNVATRASASATNTSHACNHRSVAPRRAARFQPVVVTASFRVRVRVRGVAARAAVRARRAIVFAGLRAIVSVAAAFAVVVPIVVSSSPRAAVYRAVRSRVGSVGSPPAARVNARNRHQSAFAPRSCIFGAARCSAPASCPLARRSESSGWGQRLDADKRSVVPRAGAGETTETRRGSRGEHASEDVDGGADETIVLGGGGGRAVGVGGRGDARSGIDGVATTRGCGGDARRSTAGGPGRGCCEAGCRTRRRTQPLRREGTRGRRGDGKGNERARRRSGGSRVVGV